VMAMGKASCSNSSCNGDPTLASWARALVYNWAAKRLHETESDAYATTGMVAYPA
jgi:hypothetical protein